MSVALVNSLKSKLYVKTETYVNVTKYSLDEPEKYKKDMFRQMNLKFLFENEECINLNKIMCYV